MHNSGIYTVSSLTEAVRRTLEGALPFVWVRGQVANLSRPSSGHVYFSLKDDECSLSAVWFKANQNAGEHFDPLTGEVYEEGPRPSIVNLLENGQELVCAGRMRVYGARGVYQLVVELAQDAGLGRLHEEFERLRLKLSGLGYFALERKRPLPKNPKRVAVVTAPTGAVVHDFLRIAEGRGFGAQIRIYPSLMQGETAPASIINAMGKIVADSWAETVVLIRGGGSLEDLWAFNDEALARAIFEYPLPVLAGIGHEVDFTFADMTADVRAATPTHAAQLLWPTREELMQRLDSLDLSLERAESLFLDKLENRLSRLAGELAWRSPKQRLENLRERLGNLQIWLEKAARVPLERFGTQLDRLYALILHAPERVLPREAALRNLGDRLDFCGGKIFNVAERRLENLEVRLAAVDPDAPLERGYALVMRKDGSFVRSASNVEIDEDLTVKVHDGEISVRVLTGE